MGIVETIKMKWHRGKLNRLVKKYGLRHEKVFEESQKLDYYIGRYYEKHFGNGLN